MRDGLDVDVESGDEDLSEQDYSPNSQKATEGRQGEVEFDEEVGAGTGDEGSQQGLLGQGVPQCGLHGQLTTLYLLHLEGLNGRVEDEACMLS